MAATILESKTKISNLESKDRDFETEIGKLVKVDNDLIKKSVSRSINYFKTIKTNTFVIIFHKENMAATILSFKTKISNLEAKDSSFETKIGKLMEVDNDQIKKSVSTYIVQLL